MHLNVIAQEKLQRVTHLYLSSLKTAARVCSFESIDYVYRVGENLGVKVDVSRIHNVVRRKVATPSSEIHNILL